MGEKIYSAAKAIIMEKGKSREEIWDDFSKAFNLGSTKPTLMINGYPIEHKVKGVTGILSEGDVFKYSSYLDSSYVTITGYEPHSYLSYTISSGTTNAKEILQYENKGYNNSMQIYFRDHVEGTIIEIHRKQRGNLSFWDKLTNGKNLATGASHLLSGIISKFYEGLNREPHSRHVKLDNSLK